VTRAVDRALKKSQKRIVKVFVYGKIRTETKFKNSNRRKGGSTWRRSILKLSFHAGELGLNQGRIESPIRSSKKSITKLCVGRELGRKTGVWDPKGAPGNGSKLAINLWEGDSRKSQQPTVGRGKKKSRFKLGFRGGQK